MSEQSKNGRGMTLAACLWMGLFPLLQGGTYTHLTHDKWVCMLILTGVTLICFLFDRLRDRKAAQPIPHPAPLPLLPAAGLCLWTVISCLVSASGPDTWLIGEGARYSGLVTELCLFLLFALFFFSRVNLTSVLISAGIGAAVFFAVVMLQRAGGNPLGLYPGRRSYLTNPEFQGTIGNIDLDTGYLLLLCGLFFGFLVRLPGEIRKEPEKKRKRIFLFLFTLAALLLCVYLIVSMGVQFGLVSLFALAGLTALRLIPKKKRLLPTSPTLSAGLLPKRFIRIPPARKAWKEKCASASS